MEISPLPFEHKTSDLAVDCINTMGEVPMSVEEMGAFITGKLGKEIKTPQDLLHVATNEKHGGGFHMFLSLVATNSIYLNGLDDGRVRLVLFRSAEEAASRQRSILAGIELGVTEFSDSEAKKKHANHTIENMYNFQERLLQRVSPTDPRMRK